MRVFLLTERIAEHITEHLPIYQPRVFRHKEQHHGTHHGTPTASQPLCPKASQSPKNKIEEKDKNLSGSIPQYEGIQSPKTNQQEEAQPRIPKSPTEEEYHLCFDTYNVCLNREPNYDEKMKLVRSFSGSVRWAWISLCPNLPNH